jgi:hypothetical protein
MAKTGRGCYNSLMPDDLYERDILIWSERQAELLRRIANGERVNDVDWPHVIEEIADVGSAEFNSVQSYLRQAMMHLFKLHHSPGDLSEDHWRTEIDTFLADAEQRFSPSMRQRIDLEAIYAKARTRSLRRSADQVLPQACPWTLGELLIGDVDALLAALRA